MSHDDPIVPENFFDHPADYFVIYAVRDLDAAPDSASPTLVLAEGSAVIRDVLLVDRAPYGNVLEDEQILEELEVKRADGPEEAREGLAEILAFCERHIAEGWDVFLFQMEPAAIAGHGTATSLGLQAERLPPPPADRLWAARDNPEGYADVVREVLGEDPNDESLLTEVRIHIRERAEDEPRRARSLHGSAAALRRGGAPSAARAGANPGDGAGSRAGPAAFARSGDRLDGLLARMWQLLRWVAVGAFILLLLAFLLLL